MSGGMVWRKPWVAALLTALPILGPMAALLLWASMASAQTATTTPVVDGYVQDPVTGVVEAPYVAQGITYTQDQVTGKFAGLLYSAEDSGRFYFAYAQSPLINDNTYGTNQIGWSSNRPHRLSDLLNSDNARVQLYGSDQSLVYDFRLDYATQDKNTGKVSSLGVTGGDGSIVVGNAADIVASSALAWNFNLASPTWSSKLSTNPRRIPTNTYASTTTANPSSPWIYELVYEFSVPRSRFPGGILGGIEVLEVHNSPTKNINPVPVPVLNVKKVAGPSSGSSVQPGTTITYTITVTNVGASPIVGVVVTDKVDPNLNAVVPLTGGTYNSSTKTVTWNVGTLAVGQTVALQFSAKVLSTAAVGAKVYNAATVTAPSMTSPLKTNATVHNVVGVAAISLTKAASPTSIASATVGAKVTYTFSVKNTGTVTLTNLTLVDDKVSGPIALSATTLAPGASTTATAVYYVTQADIDAGKVVNMATASGTAPSGYNPPTVSASATATVTLGRTPAIKLVKTANPTSMSNPTTGSSVYYSYTVVNTGNVTLSNLALTDDKIAGLIALGAAALAPGASTSGTASYFLTQADIDAGKVINTAVVTADAPTGAAPSSVMATAAASVTLTRAPAIALQKAASPSSMSNPALGDVVTYSYILSNIGNVTLTGLTLVDDKISGVITLPGGPLAPGGSVVASAMYAVTQADIDAGKVTNVAKATGSAPTGVTPSTVTASATATVTLAHNPAIALVKTASPTSMSSPVAGSTVAYSYTVTNTGNVTLTAASLTDDKIVGAITLSSATLAPGATATAGASYVLTQADIDAGLVTNTATVTGTAPSGTSPSTVSATDSVTVTLARNPAIAVTKTASPASLSNPTASSTVAYTYSVTNTGNVTLTAVTLSDDKAGAVGLSATTLAPGASANGGVTYTLTQADLDSGAVTNVATATGAAPTGATPSSVTASASATVALQRNPAIALVKSLASYSDLDGSGNVTVGDVLTYNLVATNTGNVTLTGVSVTDPLPGLTMGICATASLAPGASLSCTAVYTVAAADATTGQVVNTATATGTPPTGGPVTATDSETVEVMGAKLTLTKTTVLALVTKSVTNSATVSSSNTALASASNTETATVATQVTYTLTVTNTGTASAFNVALTDTLPSGVTVTANPDGGGVSGNSITWNVGTVAAGQSVTVTITVLVD